MTPEDLQPNRLPRWAPRTALAWVLLLAWPNFLFTGKWASLPGALNGWRQPWYGAALFATTTLALMTWRRIGARRVEMP